MPIAALEKLMGLPDRTEDALVSVPGETPAQGVVWFYVWRNTEPWGRGTYEYVLGVRLLAVRATEEGEAEDGLVVADWSWTEARVR